MKKTLSTLAALALIIGSGLVHGAWTNRWRTSAALKELVARLDSVPMVIGDWTATTRATSSKEMAIAGAVGHLTRVYTNPKTGASVSVMLLCGLPGNISTHTPDICYPGAGYALGTAERYLQKYGDPRTDGRVPDCSGQPIRDQSVASPALLDLACVGGWSTPENTRWAFAAEPWLAKLYVVRETGGAASRSQARSRNPVPSVAAAGT